MQATPCGLRWPLPIDRILLGICFASFALHSQTELTYARRYTFTNNITLRLVNPERRDVSQPRFVRAIAACGAGSA